ncbi:MAG: chitin deacetylase [Planctomycetia bacterium 21-64-5]|nr:MAG: chitin deacetylase [Planctomycetia bacterium 21-64-5]HQU43670.1 polysaccharide deacetylase family protein [Pirellulales bacterium]
MSDPLKGFDKHRLSRRGWMATAGALAAGRAGISLAGSRPPGKARIAITLDLEMSREYPRRDMTEWDYEKGNLDDATKQYAVEAARLVKQAGGRMHFFCVGRVLEQPNVGWLKQIAADHAVGNHTYDHVYVLAARPEETQFRFRRAPWLIRGKSVAEVIEENIRLTTIALRERAGIAEAGFRTPGGFAQGLSGREDVQQLLLRLGYTWVSSKYPSHLAAREGESPPAAVFDSIVAAQREAQPFVYPSGLIELPMSPISDVNAFRSNRWKLADFLKAIRLGVTWAIDNRQVFDFLAHPSCLVVEDPKFEAIRLICDLVHAAGNRAELTDLIAIAGAV